MVYLPLTLFTLLVFASHCAEGIKCFVCSSTSDWRCRDYFDTFDNKDLLRDCNRSSEMSPIWTNAVCRKLKRTDDGRTVVLRSCAWLREDDYWDEPCYDEPYRYKRSSVLKPVKKVKKLRKLGKRMRDRDHCSTCFHDGCNSGVKTASEIFLICLEGILLQYLRGMG